MVELSGYSREELLDMKAIDLLDEQSQARFEERARRWLAGEKPKETVEYRVKAKDGRIIYAMLDTTFTKDEQGRPLGAMVIGHDVTERKQAEIFNKAINEINRSIHSTLEFNEVIDRSLSEAAKALGCDTAALQLRRQDNRWLVTNVFGFSRRRDRLADGRRPGAARRSCHSNEAAGGGR